MEGNPTATADLLELYFSRVEIASGAAGIYVSTRSTQSEPWGAAVVVPELTELSFARDPEVASDGLTIWLTGRPNGNQDIFVSVRSSRLDEWSPPVAVPELNTDASDGNPTPNGSRLKMVFHSSRSGGLGSADLYATARDALDQPWDAPMPIEELNTVDGESSPFLRDGDLEIFFESAGPGGEDIFAATRISASDPFGPPVLVDELNGPNEDSDPWVSPDGRYALFASDRTGPYKIYEVTR